MPRRVSLPGASELFRPTVSPSVEEVAQGPLTDRKPWTDRVTSGTSTPAVPADEVEEVEAALAARKAVRARKTTTQTTPRATRKKAAAPRATASGRVRHDEKITVYVSREELLALETGRLALRGEHDLAVDRGRIVRESIALAMEDLAARGAESDLVRRLMAQ